MQTKQIVLGVSGGIAAYKTAELTRLLTQMGHQVQVAMSDSAQQFITPLTFQALSGNPVFTSLWDSRPNNGMAHIDLGRKVDAILIAPASANIIAKLAHGIADDLLSTLCLARDCPLLLAPAMNKQMWNAAATQRNIAQLQADGVQILGPTSGSQACGEVGMGRMLEAAELAMILDGFFQPKALQGQRVLITAGATFEAIDPVRGITNLSSGKMGFALARAAQEAGASVTLIAGHSTEPTPYQVARINTASAQAMYDAVHAHIAQHSIFISVAAVADYRVNQSAEHKLKKHENDGLTLQLTPNPDILASVACLPNPPYCVGFAAETQHLLEYAQAKRLRKNIPLLAANLVQNSMGGDTTHITLVDAAGCHPLPAGSKLDVARTMIAEIAQRVTLPKKEDHENC